MSRKVVSNSSNWRWPRVWWWKKCAWTFSACSPARARPEPESDLGMTEEELSIGNGQAEIDCEEDLGDLCGRRAETIQGGAAPAGKAFVAGWAASPLNAIPAALAVTDQGMKSRVGVAKVIAVRARASVARGAEGLGLAARAFALAPWEDARLADIAPQGRGVRATTHRAILGSARLEWTRCLALG